MVALLWLVSPAVWWAPSLGAAAPTIRPEGTAWLPVDPIFATGCAVVVVVGALLALANRNALGFALIAAAGLYLGGLPQLLGATQHNHHLLWLAILLALLNTKNTALIRASVWVVFAAIYFFPGLAKLRAEGLSWAGDPLWTLWHYKLAQAWSFEPVTPLSRGWVQIGGTLVLLFELSAPLLILHRWGRRIFVLAAVGFHVGTALWFAIDFHVLALCIAAMWPPSRTESSGTGSWTHRTLCGLMLIGVVQAGVREQTQAWPFACYPTFARAVPNEMPTLVLVGESSEGEREVGERLLAEPQHSQAFYARAWAIGGFYGPPDQESVGAFVHDATTRPEVAELLSGSHHVRLHRAWVSVTDGSTRVGSELGRWAHESDR